MKLPLPQFHCQQVRQLLGVVLAGAATTLGAAPSAAPLQTGDFQPRLKSSVYQPVASRDPFLAPGASAVSTGPANAEPTTFRLDGFLGQTNNLSAIVNGVVLSLNKPVMLETGGGRIAIKAVQITMNGVVLEVGGKRLELKRATASLPTPELPR